MSGVPKFFGATQGLGSSFVIPYVAQVSERWKEEFSLNMTSHDFKTSLTLKFIRRTKYLNRSREMLCKLYNAVRSVMTFSFGRLNNHSTSSWNNTEEPAHLDKRLLCMNMIWKTIKSSRNVAQMLAQMYFLISRDFFQLSMLNMLKLELKRRQNKAQNNRTNVKYFTE